MGSLKNPTCHAELLNYQLKHLVNLGGAPAIRVCEGGFGVARSEWRMVAALVEHGPATVGELVEATRMEGARVSRLLASLQGKGFVQRLPAGGRSRAPLAATASGEKLYRELFPRLAAINRRLMEVLDENEARVLQDLLARLTARAEAVHAEGGGVREKADRYLGTGRRRALRAT